MKVALCAIADHVSGGDRGKLSIIGIFDTIWTKNFPTTHLSMSFVTRMLADYADSEQNFDLRVRLVGPDGEELLSLGGDGKVGTLEPGAINHVNLVFQLNQVTFPRSGTYMFVVSINGDVVAESPLRLAVGS